MIKFNDLLSKGDYVFLPTKGNPKVILNISSQSISHNSFKLYNPFSLKAKVFKFIVKKIALYFSSPFKYFLGHKYVQTSPFILEIEKKLNTKIHSSIYFATAKDKVVLQLQSNCHTIIGYLKLSLNQLGNTHISNEIKAIKILIKTGVVDADYLIHSGTNNGFKYCILKNIDGKIDKVSHHVIKDILQTLHLKSEYKLSEHPRVLNILAQLESQDLHELKAILDNVIGASQGNYKLVYEHGDFAEWNIIKVGNDYRLFDFEYFEEDGLEYLDLIKFHYQKAFLLSNYRGSQLIDQLEIKISLSQQFKELFIIYLIKEISLKTKEGSTSNDERAILKSLLQ